MAIVCRGLGVLGSFTGSSSSCNRATACCYTASAATRGQHGCARSCCLPCSTFLSWRQPSACGALAMWGALAARPTVWTYRLSVTFRSTSLSDRPRVRIDRQAVKLITKAYRLTLAFRSTSSGRPFAVAVGYLGLSVRRLRALAFRPTSAVRCSPLPSGTLVCLVVWSSSSCIVASPPQVRSKSARFWGSYVLIARRIDCRLHRLASKGGLCSCS